MAIREAMLKEAKKKRDKKAILQIQRKVFLKTEWKDKCPQCGGQVKVVWTSPDGKAKAYKCKKGHPKKGQVVNEAWLVRE